MAKQKRAAQYLRSSTGQQDSSMVNQASTIALYAVENDLRIVRSFADRGRSGVKLAKRPGLQRLLQMVMAGEADFEVLLIHDVSRWGRFQDTDESAHYEWVIRDAGIAVHYCAEPFLNETGLVGAILKTVKRSASAEYVRELSAKVFAGQARLISSGYWACGRAPYGTRRMVIDALGQPRGVLEAGERKSVRSDRVVLVQGPLCEMRIVRLVFRLASRGMGQGAIAEHLNEKGVMPKTGRRWTRRIVGTMLANECYLGRIVFNRTTKRLGSAEQKNQKNTWIVRDGHIAPMVKSSRFDAVGAIRSSRRPDWDKEKIIAKLAKLLSRTGYLTGQLIDASPGMPSVHACRKHFGSLWMLYLELGYVPASAANGARRGRTSDEIRRSMARITKSISDAGGSFGRGVNAALLADELEHLRSGR